MRRDEDPARIAAELGLNIGTIRGRLRPADMSPLSIVSAVTMGEGFGRPRVAGVAYLALSLACSVFGAAMLHEGHLFYVIVPHVPILGLCGLWLVLTGEPVARRRPKKIRRWARLGLGACLVTGVLLGFATDLGLLFGWWRVGT